MPLYAKAINNELTAGVGLRANGCIPSAEAMQIRSMAMASDRIWTQIFCVGINCVTTIPPAHHDHSAGTSLQTCTSLIWTNSMVKILLTQGRSERFVKHCPILLMSILSSCKIDRQKTSWNHGHRPSLSILLQIHCRQLSHIKAPHFWPGLRFRFPVVGSVSLFLTPNYLKCDIDILFCCQSDYMIAVWIIRAKIKPN